MNTVHIYHTNCRDHCKPQSRKQQGSVLLFHLVFLKQPYTTPPSPALASLHSPSLEPEAHFQALTLSWLCVMPSFLSPQHAASLPHCLGRPQMLVGQKAQPVMWGCCGGMSVCHPSGRPANWPGRQGEALLQCSHATERQPRFYSEGMHFGQSK